MKLSIIPLWLFITPIICMGQDVPFFTLSSDKKQDIGAYNQNFRDIVDRRDILSQGDSPKLYKECIGSPLFCVDKYNRIVVLTNTNLKFSTTTSSYGLIFQDGTTLLTRPVVSTAAIVLNLDALNLFASTATTKIDAGGIFITTATSRLDALEAFRSTATLKISAHDLFMSTGNAVIGAHEAFRSTATSVLDAHQAFLSTSSTKMYATGLFITTATSVIDAHEAFRSTGSAYIGAWNQFASTGPSIIGAYAAGVSTTASYLGAWNQFASTGPSHLGAWDAFSATFTAPGITSTATIVSVLDAHTAFVSTASTKISALGIGITTAASLSLANTFQSSITARGPYTSTNPVNASYYQISGSTVVRSYTGTSSIPGNIAIGDYAGYSNTAGNYNTFIGYKAGYSADSDSNLMIGYRSGELTTGSNNLFIGYESGISNTTGIRNLFIGSLAGEANTTGNGNIFIGRDTGSDNTTGEYNLAFGYETLVFNRTGTGNVAIGYRAGIGSLAQSLSSSTIIGYESGKDITGSDNILIGYRAGYAITTGTGNLVIGYNQQGATTDSSTLNIGGLIKGDFRPSNSSVTINNIYAQRIYAASKVLIAGQPEYSAKLDVTGNISATGQIISSGTGNNYLAGSLGIKNTSPAADLHITGVARAGTTAAAVWISTIGLSAGIYMTTDHGAQQGAARVRSASWYDTPSIGLVNQPNFSIDLSTTSQADYNANPNKLYYQSAFVIQGNNFNVGIGSMTPAVKLDVAGTIRQTAVTDCTLGLTTDASGGITGCVSSDERLKKNIVPFAPPAGNFALLEPVKYEWAEQTSTSTTRVRDARVHVGFTAQAVERLYPEAVSAAGKGLLGVDPNAMNAILVKKVQELEARIKALEKP